MSGWIKLNRNVVKHWIFKDEWKFKCWIDLLVSANYSENKIEIKGALLTCKRGELLYSLDSLSIRWNSNKSKVRRFLKLLESDSMIKLKSEQVTTRITICNYDSYQSERNEDETQTKHKRNEDETQTTPIKEYKEHKEEKKDKELNKQLIISSTPKNEFSESVNNFYDYVLKYFEEKFIPKTDKQISSWKESIDKLIRIDGYDLKHIHEIIKTFREDNFWKTNFNSLPKLREKNNTGEKYIDVFSVKLKNKNQNGKQSTFGETRDDINDRAKREISTSIINTLNGELREQFGH